MATLLETVVHFFDEDEWPVHEVIDGRIVTTGFDGDNGAFDCYALVRETDQQVVFYSVSPVKAPEAFRLAMAEFLTRANYEVVVGNFEMDFEDGEIRYKTSIAVEGDRLTSALLKQIVHPNVLMMDTYIRGFRRVIEEGFSPAQAVREVEAGII